MVDTGATEARVDLGGQRRPLADQKAREQRGGSGRQHALDGLARLALDDSVPGSAGVIDHRDPVGARGADDVDALALQVVGIVEAAGISKPRRAGQADLGAYPLAVGQRRRFSVCRDL